MMQRRALFVYTNISSFISGDIDILSEQFKVTQYRVDNSSPLRLSFSLARLFIFLLFRGWHFNLFYIWFADYHSFLPVLASKVMGKRSVVVAGGYDVCRERKYSYGSFVKPLRAYMAHYSIANAGICLAVSENVARIIRSIAPKANCTVLYNGVNLSADLSMTMGNKTRADKSGVLCVSFVSSEQSFYIKGIDHLISAASILKDYQFTLVGSTRETIEKYCKVIPDNLYIAGRVTHSDIVDFYSKAKVYCQFSRRESFCLALAESMLFNCVPVIANVGGMPEVTGGAGVIVSDYSTDSISSAILKGLSDNSEYEFAERIRQNFTLEIRKQKLLRLLK